MKFRTAMLSKLGYIRKVDFSTDCTHNFKFCDYTTQMCVKDQSQQVINYLKNYT